MRRSIILAAIAAVGLSGGLLFGPADAQSYPGGGGSAPPGSIQRDLDKKFSAMLVGRWVVSYNAVGMQYTNDILYRPDGSLVGTQIVQQYTELRYPLKGTWRLTGIDETTFNLTLNIAGSGTSNDTLTVIDANTLFSQSLQENVRRTQ